MFFYVIFMCGYVNCYVYYVRFMCRYVIFMYFIMFIMCGYVNCYVCYVNFMCGYRLVHARQVAARLAELRRNGVEEPAWRRGCDCWLVVDAQLGAIGDAHHHIQAEL